MWRPDAQEGYEAYKIKWELVPYTRGRVLDLGCGPAKPFPHFIGIDSNVDKQLFGSEAVGRNITGDVSDLSLFGTESCDAVFSSHTLEHIKDYKAALAEWWRVIKPYGYLCLYLPHRDHYPNVGTPGANPDHKHDFTNEQIIEAMKEIAVSYDLVRNEVRSGPDDNEYSFFQVFQKLPGKRKADRSKQEYRESYLIPKPAKRVAVIRYGAYGDILQSAAILPALKADGYHVTWYCTPRGHEVIKHDPNIDAFVIQDEDQVPNHEIGPWVDWVATQYDRCINLCESVEGILLPTPDRATFKWPKAALHALCNKNYVEWQFRIADIPFPERPVIKFHTTEPEREWAARLRAKVNGPVVVWALAGSAVHKVWPHVDPVVARIRLAVPNAVVVFTGGHYERALGEPWRKDPNVWNKAGEWTIRQSLAFAQVADLVIGPETGVLNAVATEPNHKIVFLSHSTVENLTRDWVNTVSLEPVEAEAPCYPCHKLHNRGFDTCHRHPDGGAICAVSISPEMAWKAVKTALGTMVAGRITDEFDAVVAEIVNAQ